MDRTYPGCRVKNDNDDTKISVLMISSLHIKLQVKARDPAANKDHRRGTTCEPQYAGHVV